MFRAEIEALEARYEVMGDALLGSVRPLPVRGWHWLFEESKCIYWRDKENDVGIHSVFTEHTEGQLAGKQFYFNLEEILYVFDIALSESERTQPRLGRYMLGLHQFEYDIDPERATTIDATDQELFWQSLRAPLEDL